jgi:mono/diheme cytochrome c family protein
LKTIKRLLALLILLAIAAAAWVWSGLYPIGADVPHWAITYRILETLRDRSIAEHAQDVQVPVLDTAEQVADGAGHYNEMCRGCHLAPGMVGTELRAGLYPKPPNLTQRSDLTPAQMFWTIKHGIKLSGMPAWGVTHSDQKIWAIVAFIRKLPGMTPEQYEALTRERADATHEQGAHEHGNDDATGGTGAEGDEADHAHADGGGRAASDADEGPGQGNGVPSLRR